MNDLVSVVICFYNEEKYLADSINSVLAQSYKNLEVIVINDGSTDSSDDVISAFNDPRLRYVKFSDKRGLAYRLNHILSSLNGNYIARMDADDLICSQRISKQVKVLNEYTDIDLVTTGIHSINLEGEIVYTRIPPGNIKLDFNKIFKTQHHIVHASVMARKSFFERNLYDESLLRAQDHDLWLRCFLNDDLKVHYIREPLYSYREDGNLTKEKMAKAYNTAINLLDRYYILSPLSRFQYIQNKFFIYLKKLILSVVPFELLKVVMLKRRSK
ncbi:glycosyltransferase [Vibrio atlanticus]|nr:glycosyltransferase [Vibrio atlanticus]